MDDDTLEPATGQLITRAATVTPTANTAAREFTAVGVPFDVTIEHEFGAESFAPGSVREPAGGAIVLYVHGEPIGRVIASTATDAGYQVTARLSDTTTGREVWTLISDGVLRSMSLGFVPIKWHRDPETNVLIFDDVIAREFSVVPFPAYAGAAIDPATLRHQPTTTTHPRKATRMDDDDLTRADLAPLEESLEDLRRSVAQLGTPAGTDAVPAAAHRFRSMGDFLKAAAQGDPEAAEFHRAYTGGTISDAALSATFVGDLIKLVRDRRRVMDLFSTGTLPAEGSSVDYRQLASDSTEVTKQLAEGDPLPMGKVTLTRKNAPVETYGGGAELSLQEVLRGTGVELQTTLTALAIRYARATDAAVAATVNATMTTQAAGTAGSDYLTLGAGATADDWLDLIIDGAVVFEDRGFQLSGLVAGVDRFKELVHLKDGDRRLMAVTSDSTGMKVGHVNVPGLTGDLATVPVHLVPKLAPSTLGMFDPIAVKVLESAGAPAQLQDENILNLTKAWSLYGFMARLVPFPTALVPVVAGV